MDEDEDNIIVVVSREDAKRFARLLRMVGTEHPDSPLVDTFDNLAVGLGAHLGITSNSDDNDELDESLDSGDSIGFDVYDSEAFGAHSPCTEVRVVYTEDAE